MKKNVILILMASALLSSCSHKVFRTISTPNYYTKLDQGQVDTMVAEFNETSRFNRSLSIYNIDPKKENDSSFVRLEGFVIKREIIEELLLDPVTKGIKIQFGQNGFDKRGLLKRPNINLIISAIDINGFKFNSIAYDKIPPCPQCKLQ